MPTQRLARLVSVSAFLPLLAAVASGQTTTIIRLSVNSNDVEGDKSSSGARMSDDGWMVAFSSDATNFDSNDMNGFTDAFLHNRWTGSTQRISLSHTGGDPDGPTWVTSMSEDGRYVGMFSGATNLVPGDTNGKYDAFRFDAWTGVTIRLSETAAGVGGDGDSLYPSGSGDGMLWAFESRAKNFDSNDTNNFSDIYLKDLNDGSIRCISFGNGGISGNGDSFQADMAREGKGIAYSSAASNFWPVDLNFTVDVFVTDIPTGVQYCASVDAFDATAGGPSFDARLSWDHHDVVFGSFAPNLVSGDMNGFPDVFHRDLVNATTICVSVNTSGVPGNGFSFAGPVWGRDPEGSRKLGVAFTSSASDLVASDPNPNPDCFFRNLDDGKTSLLTWDTNGSGTNGSSFATGISRDQQYILFESDASDLVSGDNNGSFDVFGAYRAAAEVYEYGCGFAGTLGVPTLTPSGPPVIGTTFSIAVSNSAGVQTVALLALGFERAKLEFPWGGELLVENPFFTPVPLPILGETLLGDLPDDSALDGTIFDLQVIELDFGALRHLSLTRGLECRIGRYLF